MKNEKNVEKSIKLSPLQVQQIEEKAKDVGVDAFIAKPLFRSRLTATLRQFTSGRKENTARNYLEKLSEADYTGKRILLVEDNELNREIGVEILQMTGAEVETAENGKIAVEKVEASPEGLYDLVFMDHAFVGVHAPKCGNRPGTIAEFAVVIWERL